MPTTLHFGLLGLLALLGALALWRGEGGHRSGAVLVQLLLASAVLVCAWTGLSEVARDHGPGLEVESLRLAPTPEGLTLGSGPDADAVLPDPHAAPIHAVVSWARPDGGDPVPYLWNASAEHRLELDGHGLHDTALSAGSTLELGDRRLEVAGGGWWPGLVLTDDQGAFHRLRAPGMRGLLALLPVAGPRIRSSLAWLQSDGPGYRLLDHPPLPGTGPVARLESRGRAAWLGFPTAADRAEHTVRVGRMGEVAVRPSERRVALRDGDRITLGYTRLAVGVERGGDVLLRVIGVRPRLPWPGPEGVVLEGDGGTLLAAGDGDELVLGALHPDGGFARRDGVVTRGGTGARRLELGAGDRMALRTTPFVTTGIRLAGRAAPVVALAGRASAVDRSTWCGFAALAFAYLLVTVLASARGFLHARTSGVLHGAALLVWLGLLCLYRLADPGDSLHAGWALRQVRLAAGGTFAFAALLLGVLLLRRRSILSPADALFRWLDGPEDDGARARWLYVAALAVLVVQLPFGEAGIALPGLGSVQPIEATRSLLVVYLAYWTARSLDGKRSRLRGVEGFSFRWRYMGHAVPVLAVLVLCYGLHDISPILIFGVFLAGFYTLTWLRPSLQLWPPRVWRDHLAVDGLLVGGVLLGAAVLLLADPSGTVARRIAVWWDPWSQTAEAYQAMTALWASASGGWFGAGWSGANAVLPPAVKDDFVLALLAARGGASTVILVAAAYAVILVSGVAGLEARASVASTEREALLAGGMLGMLGIQAAVVLGSATGGLPVMGQPLPFVAAAGSHLLLFCLPAVAVVLASTRRLEVPRPAVLRLPVPAARPPVPPAPAWEPGRPLVELLGPTTHGGAA